MQPSKNEIAIRAAAIRCTMNLGLIEDDQVRSTIKALIELIAEMQLRIDHLEKEV